MDFLSNNILSDFFLIALKWIYSIIHDYSLGIILLTILLRAVMLPLDLKQRRNTMKIAQLQPQMELLKKKFGNNPQQLQAKQKELYAEMHVKPLGGCLPMILQMLVFFAFFGAMRVLQAEQTISMFLNATHPGGETAVQIPQWLWVHNFWQPDSGFSPVLPTVSDFSSFIMTNSKGISPQALSILQQNGLISFGSDGFKAVAENYNALTTRMLTATNQVNVMNGWFILPLIAGGSLFFQQKLTAAAGQAGPQQQQMKFMLYFFPIFSIWICATSTTAFAVYWLASNVYAIGQQLIINYITNKKNKTPLVIKEAKK